MQSRKSPKTESRRDSSYNSFTYARNKLGKGDIQRTSQRISKEQARQRRHRHGNIKGHTHLDTSHCDHISEGMLEHNIQNMSNLRDLNMLASSLNRNDIAAIIKAKDIINWIYTVLAGN